MLDFRTLWQQALPYHDFVAATAEKHRPLWEAVYRLARVPSDPPGQATRLLVLAEDWCGDAVNTVPVLARWAEAQGVELRILRRDEHPVVMDEYLTNGSRSIPIVIALDASFHEVGHWGPRPRDLQAWVMAHKETMEKAERYKEVRRWYARDHGATTVREVREAMGEGAEVWRSEK
jgi:Thioredoxin